MIFFYNNNGNLLKYSPTHVYQGSNAASKLYFVAPFSPAAVVQVAFLLPNGERTGKHVLSLISDLTDVQTDVGDGYTLWGLNLDAFFTAYSGEMLVQFFVNIIDSTTEEVTNTVATESAKVVVEQGAGPIDFPIEPDTLDDIIAWATSFASYYDDKIEDLESVVQIISTQRVNIYELTAGIYKLNYAGSKYIYPNTISRINPFYGDTPVLLWVSQRGDKNDFIIFRGAEANTNGCKVYYGSTTYSTGSGGFYRELDLDKVLYNIDDYLVNNLGNSDTHKALTANMGKVLKGYIDDINSKIPTSASSANKLVDRLAWMEALNQNIVTYTFDIETSLTLHWAADHINLGTVMIDWGDGSFDEIDTTTTTPFQKVHAYSLGGTYIVKVYGLTTVPDKDYFGFNTSPKSVVISNGIFTIEDNAFSNYADLESVVIGNDVETIGYATFYNCTSLTYIKIGDGCKIIGDRVFFNCPLAQLIIGTGIESIGINFIGLNTEDFCKVVILNTNPPEIDIYAFSSTKVKIYVPGYSVDEYKTAFGDVLSALETKIFPIDQETRVWALETFAPISLVSTVNGILAKIPAQASSENQLADKSYVETLVSQNGSHFLGTFENVQALRTGTASTATNNDYANVTNSVWRFQDNAGLNGYPKDRLTNKDYAVVNQAADTGPVYDYNYYQFDIETQTWTWIAGRNIDDYDKYATYYNRYSYNADTQTWVWNFTVNNMSLSAAQIDALNSGITSAKVTEYDRKPQNYILAENENAFYNSNDEYIEVPLATALVLRYPVLFNKTAADLKVGDILTMSMSGNYPSRIVAAKNSTKVTLAYLDRGLNSKVNTTTTIAGLDLSANRSKADMLTALGFTITEVTI